jgi:hypothetical protein
VIFLNRTHKFKEIGFLIFVALIFMLSVLVQPSVSNQDRIAKRQTVSQLLSSESISLDIECADDNFSNHYALKNVYVLSKSQPDEIPDNHNKTISYLMPVILYAAIEVENQAGERIFLSMSETIRINDDLLSTNRDLLACFPKESISWFKIEYDAKDKYYNNITASGLFDKLNYKRTNIEQKGWIIEADVAPTIVAPLLLDDIAVGTMRYQLQVKLGDKRKFQGIF